MSEVDGHTIGIGDGRVYDSDSWPARNTPCCGGRFFFGPPQDHGVFACNLFLVLTNTALFSYFIAPSIHVSVLILGLLLCILTLIALFFATSTEPGILPRKKLTLEQRRQLERDPPPTVESDGIKIPLKFCETCMIYRPPRAKHCRECDNCVELFDHHCPWVCNCVGKRNYRFFVAFVFSVTMLCSYVFIFSLVLLILSSVDKGSFLDAVSDHPLALVEVLLTFLFGWCLCSLCCYHTFLIASDQTTNEYIKVQRAMNAAVIHSAPDSASTSSSASSSSSTAAPSSSIANYESLSLTASSGFTSEHSSSVFKLFSKCREFFCSPLPPSLIHIRGYRDVATGLHSEQLHMTHRQSESSSGLVEAAANEEKNAANGTGKNESVVSIQVDALTNGHGNRETPNLPATRLDYQRNSSSVSRPPPASYVHGLTVVPSSFAPSTSASDSSATSTRGSGGVFISVNPQPTPSPFPIPAHDSPINRVATGGTGSHSTRLPESQQPFEI